MDFIFRGRESRYGGYEMLAQVASGGMSRVWRARQPGTGRICALKVLTSESAEMIDVFRRVFEAEEGTIALRLDHPNVVHSFDYGRCDSGGY